MKRDDTVINQAGINSQGGADSYTDLASVNAIRSLKDKNQALDKIAQQFESMMTRMMMKSMRSANEVFAQGNFLSSHEGDMYRDMHDDQLALTLSQGRGIGLAEVMVRQLQSRYGEAETSADNKTAGVAGYLSNRNAAIPTGYSSKNVLAVERPAVDQGERPGSSNPLQFDGSAQQFVNQLYPSAQKAAMELGVDPAVLIAQSALETGWGLKLSGDSSGQSSLNFFNIKSDSRWQGDSVSVPTMEFRQGLAVRERANFRSYDSAQQSFEDYVDFIRNSSRYEQALQSDSSENYIRHLSEAGYATDPAYAEKIISILNSESLQTAVSNAAANTQLAAVKG